MKDNRKGVITEAIVILFVLVLLITTGGFLVGNVVANVRSLNTAKTDSILEIGSIEKMLQEISDKVAGERKPVLQPREMNPSAAGKKAEVKLVRFFEAGKDIPAPKERVYGNQFAPQSRYIYTEINYKNSNYQVADAEIRVTIQYYNAKNEMIAERRGTARPKKEWPSAFFIVGWGEPGQWRADQYMVRVILDGQPVGDYRFSIK